MTGALRPRSEKWQPAKGLAARGSSTLEIHSWTDGKLLAVSALEMAELPDGSGRSGPQWHVSVSRLGVRATDDECRRALRAFGMLGSEEDNHHPGVARHFWRPVDPAARVDCECKTTETVVVEPDGYRWSNEKDPTKCRGCEHVAIFGGACALHPERAA